MAGPDFTFFNRPQNFATPFGVTIGGLGLTATTANSYVQGNTLGTGYELQAGYILGSFQTFAANGTWTRPAGCRAYLVEGVAAGGGSGGCAATGVGEGAEGGGGGGGQYARRWVTNPNATETVTIGAVGTAGVAGNNAGGDAANSTFGAVLTLNGGKGGSGGANSTGSVSADGGAGGTGTTNGDLTADGSDGGTGRVFANTRAFSGRGGASGKSWGGEVKVPAGPAAGTAGKNYGSGASAASNSASQVARAGAAGGPSIFVVWEYY